jgi:hypothetical protein
MEACLPFFEAIVVAEPCTVRVAIGPTMLLELEIDFEAAHE